MVSSSASTVAQYLAELGEDRRGEISQIRQLCLDHLPQGLEEAMNWGMISYQVPLSRVPKTYNNQPLLYAAIASQKQYISLYLMSIYAFDGERERFEAAWKATGKRFNVGKACIRFRSVEDVPLEVVRDALGRISVEKFIERYNEVRGSARKMKK